jgi:hypothetical protein
MKGFQKKIRRVVLKKGTRLTCGLGHHKTWLVNHVSTAAEIKIPSPFPRSVGTTL